MNTQQAYDWLAPKLRTGERDALNVIYRDAMRYQWLREQPNDTSAPRIDVVRWTIADESANEGEGLRMGDLDAAIDEATRNGKAINADS